MCGFYNVQYSLTPLEVIMYYVYVLQSKRDYNLYTGCCNDLKSRFKKHNEGKIQSTKNRKPWKLIYYEACLSRYDAYQREKFLKSGPGKRYIKNRLKRYFEDDDIGEE